jgi:hypothetical protein
MQDKEMAAIYERVAEYIDRQYNLFDEFMYAAYDAFLYGNGIMKFGYWDDMLVNRPLLAGGVTESFGSRRSAYTEHTELYEIYPDFRARRWDKQRFLIHQVAMHIDDLRNNTSYDQKVVKTLEPKLSADKLYGFNIPNVEIEHEYVMVQEIHDLELGQVKLMVEGAEDWVFRGPEPYGIFPFENLMFMPRPKVIWGDSISQSIEHHVKDISEALTYMNRALAREGLLKVLINLAEWDEEAMQKLEGSEDAIIGITAEDLPNSYSVMDFHTAQSQFNFQTGITTLQEVIRSVTGVTMQERGRHEPGVETKFEASMLKAASDIRSSMRKRMFARFASRVIRKLLYIVTLEYSSERIAQMAGVDPSYAYTISQAGPFDDTRFKVDYGMTAANSRQERLEKLGIVMQMVGQYINPAVMTPMLAEVLDFDFVDEMMIYQAMGQGKLSGNPQAQQAAGQLAQTRVAQPQQAGGV